MEDDKILGLYNQLKNDGYELDDEKTFREGLKTDPDYRRLIYDTQKNDGYNMNGDFEQWEGRLMTNFVEDNDNGKPVDLSAATAGAQVGANIIPTVMQPQEKDSNTAQSGSNQQKAFTQKEYGNLSTVAQDVAKGVGVAPKGNTQEGKDKATGGRKQFVPEYANVKGFTINKNDPLRKKYPFLNQLTEDEQAYFRTDTNEPLYAWKDSEGKDITPDEAATLNQRADIEQNDAIRPRQVPVTSLQLPEEVKSSGIRTDKKVSEYADELLKQQYGDGYLGKIFTDENGNEISGEELRNSLAQETYDKLNEDVKNARIALFEVEGDKDKEAEINTAMVNKWKGIMSGKRMLDTLHDENAMKQDVKDYAQNEIDKAREEERRIIEEMNKRGAELDAASSPYVDQTFNTRQVDSRYTLLTTELNAVRDRIRSWEAVRDSDDYGAMRALKDTAGNLRSWDLGYSDMIKGMHLVFGTEQDKKELANLLGNAERAKNFEQKAISDFARYVQIGGQSLPFMATFVGSGGGFRTLSEGVAKGAVKWAERKALQGIQKNAVKYLGVAAGDILAGYTLSGTLQGMGTLGDIMQRKAGDIVYNTGKGEYELVNPRGWAESAYKGATASMIDNATELLGDHLNIGKAAMKLLPKAGLKQVSDWLTKAGKSELYTTTREWLKRAGINGLGGEILEEEMAIPMNAVFVGDNPLLFGDGGLLDAKTQKDIVFGVGLSVFAMNAAAVSLHGAGQGINALQTMFDKDQRRLDAADNAAIEIIGGHKWTEIKNEIDNATNEELADVAQKIADDKELSEEQKKAVGEYVTSTLQMRGHNLGENAAMHSNEQRDAYLDSVLSPEERQNVHDDGMIHSAILYPIVENGGNAEQVFIVKGNVALNNDGSVNIKNSSDAIYYRGSDGQIHLVAPNKILAADVPVSVEDYIASKNNTSSNVNQEPSQQAVQYSVGDEVNIDVNGESMQGEVAGTTEDGNYIVSYENEDGTMSSVRMSPEELAGYNQATDTSQQIPEVPTLTNAPQSIEPPVEAQQPAQAVEPEQPVESNTEQMQPANAEQSVQAGQPQAAQQAIPKDKNGRMIYDQAPVEATIQDLYNGELDDEEVQGFIDANIADAQKKYDNAQKKKPKIGTDKAKYLEQKKNWQADVDEAKRVLDYWNEVNSHLDRKKRVEDALRKGKLQYRFDGGAQTEHRPANVSVTTPLAGQGASSKGNAARGDQSVSDMENGTLVSPQLASSESKDTQTSANEQTINDKINISEFSDNQRAERIDNEEQPTVAQNDSEKAIGERLWRYVNFLNNQYGYNFEHEETFAKWITKKKNNIKWLKDKFPPNVVKEVIRAINDYNKLLTKPTVSNKIADAEAQTDINPTEAQKEAGNYKKGHVRIDGYDITIEQPKGSVRRGTDANGKKWEQTMNNTYGYIRGTEGVDGDHIDIFLSDNPTEGNVYVVDQVNPDGSFDEHKVMYGFNSADEARNAYLSNYEEGWQGLGNITEVSKDEFKKWVESSHRKTKPFAEYKSVKKDGAQNEGNTLANEAHELFSDIIAQSTHNVEINDSGISETDNTLYAPIKVDGKDTSLSLYQEEPAHSSGEPIVGVSFYGDGMTYQEAADLSDAYNQYVGEKVCTDGSDELAINFGSIDEAVRFEEWLNDNRGVRFREADNEIPDFAQKHNLNEKDVQDYADYMRRGNLNGASGAFHDIRRKIRIDNKGVSLGQFAKIFSPIRKELYEKFGNIDEMREQYVQRELEERSVMEAARKRAEEAAEAERRRLQEFHDMSDEQLDDEYMKAVEANDENRMRDLVNEAARRNGYGDVGSEYQGVGAWAAPSNPRYESDEERRAALETDGNDVNVVDMAHGYTPQPDDYFTNLRAYGNDTPHGRESAGSINKAMDEARKGKDPMIKVYRVVPKSVKEGKLRNGDWVTPSRKYAEIHGDNRLEGDYRIIEQEVPASQIWWDGNDINEWGFDDGKSYAYRNTKNNRKLNDLITRDEKGNIILLSQRFNARKSDVRYRFIGEQGAANLDATEEATTRLDNLATARQMEQAYNDKKARIEKLRDSKPVEITGNEIEPSDDLKQYKKNALEHGKKLQGSYVNKDTGRTIQLQRGRKNGGLKEVLQHDINDVAHIKSVAAIPQIIENSIYIDSADNHDTKKNPNVSKYHYYVCGLKIDGVDYTVRMVEAEDKDGNRYYDHKLTHIEKGTLIDNLNVMANHVAENQNALNQTSSTELSSTPGTGAEERNRPTNRGEIQAAPISNSKDRVLISLLQTNNQENARKIKLATGWERGTDNQWRYETPDFKFKDNPVVADFDGYSLTTLESLINDEELFKAYPQLSDMPVQYQKLPPAMLGAYSSKTSIFPAMITLDEDFMKKKENPEWRRKVELMENEPVVKAWIDAMDKEPFDMQAYEKAEKDFKASPLWDEYNNLLKGQGDTPRYIPGFSGEQALAHEIQHAIQDIEGFSSGTNTKNKQYKESAGEVEARNVETRINMTPEQRRQSLASETEDVAREDQIFLEKSLDANYSIGDTKTISGGRQITFTRANPTTTFNSLKKRLDKEGIDYKWEQASTGSRYINYERGGVNYEIRSANHTKGEYGSYDEEDDGINILTDNNKIYNVEIDLSRNDMRIDDIYRLMDEVDKFNNSNINLDEYEQRLMPPSAALKEDYPIIYNAIDNSIINSSSWLGKKRQLLDEYNNYLNENTPDMMPFVASNGVTMSVDDNGENVFTKDGEAVTKRHAQNVARLEREKAIRDYVHNNLMKYDDWLNNAHPEIYNEKYNSIIPAINETAEKLNLNVRIVNSPDEITNAGVKRAVENGRRIKGWFDTDTNEIVVYMPNTDNVDDAIRTVLHEGVAHYGLRQLVGEENFNTFLDNIYNNVSDEIKSKIDDIARKNKLSTQVATEEYLAGLAEKTNFEEAENSGVWDKIKSFFMDLLTKAGIRLNNALSDNELRYILWRSYDNLQNPTRDVINTVRDITKQRDLNVGNYAVQNSSEKVAENDDIRYREVDDESPSQSRNKFRELYEEGIKGRIATLIRAYFDRMQPMKKLQEAIEKETSQPIQPEENVYLQENRAMSIANRKYEIWERSHMEPVREAVVKLMKDIRKGNFLSDVLKRTNTKRNAYNAVVQYMKTKHGLENNEYRRNEAAMEARKPFEDEIAAVQKSIKDNKMTEADAEKNIKQLKEQADKAEAESRKSTKDNDYSGLQGIYGKDFEQKAKDYVGAFEENFKTDDFWKTWNGATKSILEEEYNAGLISKELYDKIRGMYKYYIPLKGWAENRAEDVYTYYTTGSGDGGKPQSRKGRTSESDDPLVTLEQDADRQFNAAARNNVKRSLYNLATTHKSDLLTVRRQWYQNMGTKENPDWQRVDAEIPENATPEEMEKIVSDFEKNMRELAKDGMAMRQKRPMILPYHATKRMEKEHTVKVMVNGKEYVIYVNGNPAAAQAVNGTSTPKDPDNKFLENFVLRPLRWFNRTRAALLTAWNFNFIPSNLSRDAQYSIQNMKAKEPATYVMRYVKNLGEGMAKMTSARLFYKDKKGTLDMSDPTERLFKEFLDNGGETGYSKTMTLEQRRRNNMSAINKLSGIDWAKGVRLYFDALAYVNRSVETIVRFAAYKTSREAGRSIVQSINDAKEASVNFDKHGSGEYGNKEWRLLYIFANVKFQSMRRMLENATQHPVRFTLAQAERFALGFAVPMMAKFILDSFGDDDEKDAYDALPEWMRQSGLTIPISPIVPGVPKRTFLYLPLGPEDKVWYALGEMSYHEFNSDEPNEDMAKEFASLVADLLPVDVKGYGGNMLVNLAPTAVQDIVALEQNVNYWGQPIYRETMPYNENEPGQNLAFAGTPEWFVKRAEDINRLTGGNDYSKGAFSPKPEQIEYIINQTGGGVTRVISQFIALVERAGEDGNKDIPALKNTPVLSSFVKQAEEKEGGKGFDREAYYKYIDEYEKAIHDLKAYTKGMKKGDDEASRLAEELKKSPAGERMDTIRNNIGKIRARDKAIRKLNEIEKPTPKQEMQLEKLKKESNEMKNELVDKLDDITEKRGE